LAAGAVRPAGVERIDSAPVAAEMAQAAVNFWVALTPQQQSVAGIPFKDDNRKDWHYVPHERRGLPYKQMTPTQRHLANALLAAGMSPRGLAKATTIMSLEQVLFELENRPHRDPELYTVTIFGKPGADKVWGWRVEGHHLSLNFTIVGGKTILVRPAFMGANPATVKSGPRAGTRTLGSEEDLARRLVGSLDESQQKAAIFSTKPPDEILSREKRSVTADAFDGGLAYGAMKPEQQKLLLELVGEYAARHRAEIAEDELAKLRAAGLESIRFAWGGGTEPGQGHYYRIVGPTFLIEYANVQNNANHIHSVWRDFKDDFGEDVLRRHYQEHPHD
jgi:hypothetical protein